MPRPLLLILRLISMHIANTGVFFWTPTNFSLKGGGDCKILWRYYEKENIIWKIKIQNYILPLILNKVSEMILNIN